MLRIKELQLENFRGYRNANLKLGDFNYLIGPNGVGKSSMLESVALLCMSLQFDDGAFTTGQQRLDKYLEKNIRNIGEKDAAKGFRVAGLFEYDGEEFEVVLNQNGFEKNPMLDKPWWWMGICYFARFDQDMAKFTLPLELWDRFAKYWQEITGIEIEPETYDVYFDPRYEKEMKESLSGEEGKSYIVGFWMKKYGSRVHSSKCSAGERKIVRSLSEILLLPDERQPHIVLIDNLEMHVYFKRHLKMVETIKDIFAGKQLITTTHSTVIMDHYDKSQMIDVEEILNAASQEDAGVGSGEGAKVVPQAAC